MDDNFKLIECVLIWGSNLSKIKQIKRKRLRKQPFSLSGTFFV